MCSHFSGVSNNLKYFFSVETFIHEKPKKPWKLLSQGLSRHDNNNLCSWRALKTFFSASKIDQIEVSIENKVLMYNKWTIFLIYYL